MDEQLHHLKFDPAQTSEPIVRWFSSYSTLTREIRRFTSERIQHNLEAWVEISKHITNPNKVIEAQEHWFSQALRDYTDESQRLLSISRDVCNTMMEQQAKN